MVSKLSNLLNRRERTGDKKKKEGTTIEEVEVVPDSNPVEISAMVPSATKIPEVEIEPATTSTTPTPDTPEEQNGVNSKAIVVETDEEVTIGCSLQEGIDRLRNVVDELPQECKEAAWYSGLMSASLSGLFISIVLYRVIRHFFVPDQSTFCRYFSGPFAPLFDAICQEPEGIFEEISYETAKLSDEVTSVFVTFIQSIFDGFRAYCIILEAFLAGFMTTLRSGFHELFENVEENVAWLFNFIHLVIFGSIGLVCDLITGSLQLVLDGMYRIKGLFVEEPSGWF